MIILLHVPIHKGYFGGPEKYKVGIIERGDRACAWKANEKLLIFLSFSRSHPKDTFEVFAFFSFEMKTEIIITSSDTELFSNQKNRANGIFNKLLLKFRLRVLQT